MEIYPFFERENQRTARSLGGRAYTRSRDLNKVCQL